MFNRLFQSKRAQKTKEIGTDSTGIMMHLKRDSVCLGDDVTAPNPWNVRLERDTMLSEFMILLIRYVPQMKECEWIVECGRRPIGRLISDESCVYKRELWISDICISELSGNEIFCRRRIKR